MRFPEGTWVSKPHAFSPDVLEKALKVVFQASREFSGYLRIQCESDAAFFLFFFKNDVWAAGKFFPGRHEALTVRDFFREIAAQGPAGLQISLHETDALLLKELLVFFHLEPTVKAPVNLIDLQGILSEITTEGADALVVLVERGAHNFYFFDRGQPTAASYSDPGSGEEGLRMDERLLLDAYRPDSTVAASVYRDLPIDPVAASDLFTHADILGMVHDAFAAPGRPAAGQPAAHPRPEPAPAVGGKTVTVTVIDGVARGTTRTGRLPFTIGRKEGDLPIDDKLVSRHHAVIREIAGALVIEDLGSANGTFVNGAEVKLHQLAAGDRVTLGDTVVQITLD